MAGENETETTDEQVEETATETTVETGTTESTEDNGGADFVAGEYESAFGMPAGSLKDAKDAASALELIRDYTDKTLIAGLNAETTATGTPATETKPAEQKAGKPAASGNAEIDALRAELKEVKDTLSKSAQSQQAEQVREVERRLLAEIDSWKSPKYGVGENRTYKQVKAVKALRELFITQVTGFQTRGIPVPVVETALRQVRVFDDADFKPVVKKGKADAPLGTPGRGGSAKKDGPGNIHELYMQSRQ